MSPGDTGEYDIFISYSHKADGKLASRLQRGLERFEKPFLRARRYRVFRDETDLPASPALKQEIFQHLDKSHYLVLCASPEAAESQWVNDEVARWLERPGATETLGIVWAPNQAGNEDLTVPLPRALRWLPDPYYVDIGSAGSSTRIPKKQLARIIADVTHREYREVFDAERRRQRRVNVAAAILVLSVFVASLLLYRSQLEVRQASEDVSAANIQVSEAQGRASAAREEVLEAELEVSDAKLQASEATERASEAEETSTKLDLAERASVVSATNPALGVAIALHAMGSDPRVSGPESFRALASAQENIRESDAIPREGKVLIDGGGTSKVAESLGMDRIAYMQDGQLIVRQRHSGADLLSIDDIGDKLPTEPNAIDFPKVTLSGDGLTVAAWTNQYVAVWRVEDGLTVFSSSLEELSREVRIAQTAEQRITVARLGTSGTDLALAIGPRVLLVSVGDGRVNHVLHAAGDDGTRVNHLSFAHDVPRLSVVQWVPQNADRFVSEVQNRQLTVWDVESGVELFQQNHRGSMSTLSPGGELVAIAEQRLGTPNNVVEVWAVDGGQLMAEFAGHDVVPDQTLFLGSGNRIVSASIDGSIAVWDARSGALHQQILHQAEFVAALGVSEASGELFLLDAEGALSAWSFRDVLPSHLVVPTDAHASGEVAFSRDSDLVAFGTEDGIVAAEVPTLRVKKFVGPVGGLGAVQFSADDQLVGLTKEWAGGSETLWEFAVGNGQLIANRTADTPVVGSITGAEFHVDGTLLTTPGPRLRDESFDDLVKFDTFSPEGVRIDEAAFVGTGNEVVTVDEDGRVAVFDGQNGTELRQKNERFTGVPRSVATDVEGARIAIGGVRSWVIDAQSLQTISEFVVFGGVTDIDFMPAGEALVVVGASSSGQIIHTRSGEVVAELQDEGAGAASVDVSPDGRWIVTMGLDGAVRLWRNPIHIETACAQVRELVSSDSLVNAVGASSPDPCSG